MWQQTVWVQNMYWLLGDLASEHERFGKLVAALTAVDAPLQKHLESVVQQDLIEILRRQCELTK
jgi:predicted nuclease with RNAse H fold